MRTLVRSPVLSPNPVLCRSQKCCCIAGQAYEAFAAQLKVSSTWLRTIKRVVCQKKLCMSTQALRLQLYRSLPSKLQVCGSYLEQVPAGCMCAKRRLAGMSS